MIEPVVPCTQPGDNCTESRIFHLLRHAKVATARTPLRLLNLIDGAILLLAALFLIACILVDEWKLFVERFDFRTFDRRATAIGKWVLISVALYFAFMLYAAWCSGSFDRLAR